MYVIMYFDPPYFCVRSTTITRITLEIELFTALNSFAVQLKRKNLWELHFYSS